MYSLLMNVGPLLIPVYAIYAIGCLFDTAAWKLILDTPAKSISFFRLLQVHIAGESMYRFIPAGVVVGEATKVYLLNKQSRFDGAEIVSSLVLRKLLMGLSQGIYIAIGVFLGIIFSQHFGMIRLLSVGISISVLLVFAAMGVKLSRGTLFIWLFRLLRNVPYIGPAVEKKEGFFKETDLVLKDFFIRKRKQSILAFFLFFLGWLTEAVETFLILAVLGMSVAPYHVLMFEPLVSLTRSVAFFIPGGLGVMDSGYVSAFGAAGVINAATAGVAFIVIKRSKELFWIVAGLTLLWIQGGKGVQEVMGEVLRPEIAPEIV